MAQSPTVGALIINNAVSINGDETISGAKTFSGVTTFSGTTLLTGSKLGANITTITDDTTLAATDCGSIQNVTVDAKTITLPATVVGLIFTIRNGGADGTVLVKVAPNSNDKISGLGFTAQDNKAAQNTKTTALKGDYITLLGDGSIGWYVVDCVGVWARES